MRAKALGGLGLVWIVACGGSTTEGSMGGTGGSTGGAVATTGGTSGEVATGGEAGDILIGTGGSTGGAVTHTGGLGGNTGGVVTHTGGLDGNTGGVVTHTGGLGGNTGGAVTHTGGAGGALTPTSGPVNPVPEPGSTWSYPSGDPLNSTPPLLQGLGEGIVIAGATQDPALAGLDAFEAGVESEAFVARLGHEGQIVWSRPLLEAGMPWAIDVDGNGDVIVLAPHLPTTSVLMPAYVSSAIYLAKIDADGAFVFETTHSFSDTTPAYAMAADDDGSCFVLGYTTVDVDNVQFMVAKYDELGNESWVRTFPHAGSTAYAQGADVTPDGDLVFAGTFNGTFDLGGGPLSTTASLDQWGMPTGFVARFTSAGDHVWSQNFGGPVFDMGQDVIALSDGDLLLAGMLSSETRVGGLAVSADVEDGQGFVARLDGEGTARWVTLTPNPGTTRFLAIDPDESLIHAVGSYGSSAAGTIDFLYDYDMQGDPRLGAAATTESLSTESVAVDGLGGVWISGAFRDAVDFGNDNLLTTSEAGVFLVRLDRVSAAD